MNHMPPLLTDRPVPLQIILAIVVPALFGVIAGVTLGVSEPLYLVFALLGIAGGYLAGLEHDGARSGLLRGILGGSLFGLWILISHGLFFDTAPKAHIPEPAIIHIAITTTFGALFGALGGHRRAKHNHSPAAPRTIATATA